MGSAPARRAIVFHAGALGDFVLTWPLIRALAGAGWAPTVIAADSHAALARRCLGVHALSSERREVTAMWREHAAADIAGLAERWNALLRPSAPARNDDGGGVGGVGLVISFAADERSPAGLRWLANARRLFPAAETLTVGPPSSPSRVQAWERFEVTRLGTPALRVERVGPIALHVGAGSELKRWPLDRWMDLGRGLVADGHTPAYLAGEVERERMSADDRTTFEQAGGRTLDRLDDLADALLGARAFIGADTGPTHLAAQLGLPTLALFGPTDPRVWAPAGPCVRVLAPPDGAAGPMTRIEPGRVRQSLNELLTGRTLARESK